jgi:hypothetical protein
VVIGGGGWLVFGGGGCNALDVKSLQWQEDDQRDHRSDNRCRKRLIPLLVVDDLAIAALPGDEQRNFLEMCDDQV